MFGLLPESDGHGYFSDLLADSNDSNPPPGGSGVHSSLDSSASNESEDRPKQAIENDRWHDYVLDMDDSDIDSTSQLDGECERTSMRTTQNRLRKALDEVFTSHAPVNGQATRYVWCAGLF